MTPDQLDARARQFSVASMLIGYPDAEVEATCRALGPELRAHAGAVAILDETSADGSFDPLRGRYIELFDSGKTRVSLYQTEYGRMRAAAKGHDLADVAAFYGAFGFEVEVGEGGEMLDHLAVELEFYALMLAKQAHLTRTGDATGVEIVLDATKKFLSLHLGSFAPAVSARVSQTGDAGYGALLGWIEELVRGECERLGVSGRPLDYFADAELEREPQCADNVPPVQ